MKGAGVEYLNEISVQNSLVLWTGGRQRVALALTLVLQQKVATETQQQEAGII